ncbi:hypothetical protein ACDQ58_06330 [Fusobacterium animalis]|uniref:hypothetical protein n=1 Tax=Fusobacterium animalis TaxID=76859 RepID=UPI00355905BF
MVTKKIETRDYLRAFITKANKEAGVKFNSSKLNSKEECEEYLLNLIKDLRHKKQDNKAYVKEIDSLKEEIEILNSGNKRLEAERMFYITQAEEAKKAREQEKNYKEFYQNMADKYKTAYNIKRKYNIILNKINTFFMYVIALEALSIAVLIWK